MDFTSIKQSLADLDAKVIKITDNVSNYYKVFNDKLQTLSEEIKTPFPATTTNNVNMTKLNDIAILYHLNYTRR